MGSLTKKFNLAEEISELEDKILVVTQMEKEK